MKKALVLFLSMGMLLSTTACGMRKDANGDNAMGNNASVNDATDKREDRDNKTRP